MRTLSLLLLFTLSISLGANVPRSAEPCSSILATDQEEAQAALAKLIGTFPFLKNLVAKLEPKEEVYWCEVDLKSTMISIVAYKMHGKGPFHVAAMLGNCSIGTLCEGLSSTDLDLIELDHPVVILDPDPSGVLKVPVADLPRLVRESVKASADVLYLRPGLNITSKLELKKSAGDVIDLLKNLGIDLKDLVVQMQVAGKSPTILLIRKGEWKNPFLLKNTTMTDVTFSYQMDKKAVKRTIAGWGNATVGSTDVFLYAKKETRGGRPAGEAYGLNGKQVTLKTIIDLVEAMPTNPFPTPGLSILPLDRIQIKNPAYVDDPYGSDPSDVSKFIAFIDMTIPDGAQIGAKLSAHGLATVLGYDVANLIVDASDKQVKASGTVSNFRLGPLEMGPTAAFDLTGTKTSAEMSVSGKISAWGLANQSVKVYLGNNRFAFSTSYGMKGIGDATLKAESASNYALPWKVDLDLTGVAGQIFGAGMEAYAAVKDVLPKELRVIEPGDVTYALTCYNVFKGDGVSDVGKTAGQLYSSSKGTVLYATDEGQKTLAAVAKPVDAVKDLGSSAVGLFRSGWNHLTGRGGGGGNSNTSPPPDQIFWQGHPLTNIAYNKTVQATHDEAGYPATNAVDGKDTYYRSGLNESWQHGAKPITTPHWEIDLGAAKHITAIVIRVSKEASRNGLYGAYVAVSENISQSTEKLEHPEIVTPGVRFFPVKDSVSLMIIDPNRDVPEYTSAIGEMKSCYVHAGWVRFAKCNYDSLVQVAKHAMRPIRYIRIFIPGSGRQLAISEFSVIEEYFPATPQEAGKEL